MKPKHILVTGGAGFIGSNFVRYALRNHPEVVVTNLDALTYAGNLESLADVDETYGRSGEERYRFVRGDILDGELVHALLHEDTHPNIPSDGRTTVPLIDCVVHFAAESHVDRSILGPAVFVETNVKGTLTLLEACRERLKTAPRDFRFVHVSTDEVYGSLGADDPGFTEQTPLAPNSPYSASKAGSDMLVRAYAETFGFPGIITRCSNNYGPYQFPEKLIPLMITRALRDQSLPVYGDGKNVRDWLHVEDHADALWHILCEGRDGDVYNIGGESEVANIDMVQRILTLIGKPESLIEYVTDRPGHDRRYAMNITKMRDELDWTPSHTLDAGLTQTVEWYLGNQTWWERVISEAYRAASQMYLTSAS